MEINGRTNKLKYRSLGIDTQQEHVVYMRHDCQVCLSEGFEALTRVRVSLNGKSLVATLNVLYSRLLDVGEVSLSVRAESMLDVVEGNELLISHLDPIFSLSFVRGKIWGHDLGKRQMELIMEDVVSGAFSNIHLSAFITACAANRLNLAEVINLTRAMIKTGQKISWDSDVVADKHCVGGLPGNRTTPLIVAIAAASGLKIPKTSSRAITSPAGTADTMEVMAPVNLDRDEIRSIVSSAGGCIVWGNAAELSPADEIIIRVERALDLDSDQQLIASVLAKKVSAGSTHVVIDIPVGETAKVRSHEAANELKYNLEEVAAAVGLEVKVVVTDGSQPVGRGLGPALEAMDVLSVLRGEPEAPEDLRERALQLAGKLLELTGKAEAGRGFVDAETILDSGLAHEKFMEICKAQGGFTEPEYARYSQEIHADRSGTVTAIDNRKLAKVAKLAGAPGDSRAGLRFMTPLGTAVGEGDVLFTVYAESAGELEYALGFIRSQSDIIQISAS